MNRVVKALTAGMVVAFPLALAAPAAYASPKNNVDWTSPAGPTTDDHRYSPLSQINTSNVQHLKPLWQFNTGVAGGNEDYPIEVNGVLYVTTSFDHVMAINAKTGQQLWSYKPNLKAFVNFGVTVNRGVAYGQGKVYLLTLDARLIALNAKTGKVEWQQQIANNKAGYYESVAPIYSNGVLLIGSSGGDNGIRGFEEARGASTGKLLWQFHTVPSKSDKGSWIAQEPYNGGGAVWMWPAIWDGMAIFSVGNPAPDFYGVHRKGGNPWTDSVVAVNLKSGKLVWGHQEQAHDLWDYDAASPPTLFPVKVHGKTIMAVGEASKGGLWWVFNAKTGASVHAPQAFVKIKHSPPTVKGTVEWPGVLGGSEWSPVPYDPQTGYTYVSGDNIPANDVVTKKIKWKKGEVDFGTSIGTLPHAKVSGTFTAFNVNTGKQAWQWKTKYPMAGGATATAGGLVFTESMDGHIYGLNAKTGKILWKGNIPYPQGSAPIVYELNGREILLVPSGGSLVSASSGVTNGPATFTAFALPKPGDRFKVYGKSAGKSTAGGTSSSKSTKTSGTFVKDGRFMSYNTSSKTVKLTLIAGDGSTNNGFNFDNAANGQMNVKVPKGWTVDVTFSNKASLPHSAVITPWSAGLQQQSPHDAFKGSNSANPISGISGGTVQTYSFVASSTGKFRILCLVPGHGDAGMWDTFTVTSSGTPSINVK